MWSMRANHGDAFLVNHAGGISVAVGGGATPGTPRTGRRSLARRVWRVLWMSLASLAVLIAALVGAGVVFWKTGHLERWAVEFVTAQIAKGTPQDKPWPPEGWKPGDPLPPDPWSGPHLDAARVEDPRLFFDPTNIWLSHLHFTGEQWTRLGPRRIPPVPGFIRGDGKMILRNPVAKRNGVLGALGYEFDWSAADFEVGGVVFTNVGTAAATAGPVVVSVNTVAPTGSFAQPSKAKLLATDRKSTRLNSSH